MAWASGTRSLIFNSGITDDGSSRMKSEVYRNILSARSQSNASNQLGGASSCSKAMIRNSQHKTSSKRKSVRLWTGQVSHQTLIP